MIKAIFCDVDGTLLNTSSELTKRTQEAIKAVKEAGYFFGLCTGREAHSLLDLMDVWGIREYVDAVVGTGGAEFVDFTKNVQESKHPLDGALIKEIIQHFQGMDANYVIPHQGALYAAKEDRHIKVLSEYDQIPYIICDFDEFLKEPRSKMMIICDEDYMPKIIERASTFHNDAYKCASLKTASVLYEYMNPNISKTDGLCSVLALHDWTLENLCVIGDADNDLDMIQNAAVGVVMGNGSDACKAAADYETDDNEHDGVAVFIERYFLGKERL